MKRVEFAVNSEQLDLFEAWWKSNHFPMRNEALRQIPREKVERARQALLNLQSTAFG